MPISSAIKGLTSIKSMQNVVKSGIPNKEESDFIKLYMLEKERTRLKSEEIRILLRLEFVQGRLKEIQDYKGSVSPPGMVLASLVRPGGPGRRAECRADSPLPRPL